MIDEAFRSAVRGPHAIAPGNRRHHRVINANTHVGIFGRSLEEAEPFVRKALEIREEVLGFEAPLRLRDNNLAWNPNALKRPAEAETFFGKAPEIRQKTLGRDHPSTASSLNGLASHLSAQGRWTKLNHCFVHSRIRERLPGRIIGPLKWREITVQAVATDWDEG